MGKCYIFNDQKSLSQCFCLGGSAEFYIHFSLNPIFIDKTHFVLTFSVPLYTVYIIIHVLVIYVQLQKPIKYMLSPLEETALLHAYEKCV